MRTYTFFSPLLCALIQNSFLLRPNSFAVFYNFLFKNSFAMCASTSMNKYLSASKSGTCILGSMQKHIHETYTCAVRCGQITYRSINEKTHIHTHIHATASSQLKQPSWYYAYRELTYALCVCVGVCAYMCACVCLCVCARARKKLGMSIYGLILDYTIVFFLQKRGTGCGSFA